MADISWTLSAFTMMVPCVAVAFCYQQSPKFRYIFKFCFFVTHVAGAALLTIPCLIFRPKNVNNLKWTVPRLLTRPLPKLLGISYDVHGASVFDGNYPCVVVCNHQSALDILVMAEIWPLMRRCAGVAKKELLYVFPFGPASWLSGIVFIDRANGTDSRVKLSKSAEWIRENKTKLWIFPEGTRRKGPSLGPFKKGAFCIAVQNKLPIVPVVVSPYTFIDDEKCIFDSGKLTISILPPISTTDSTDINVLIETTHHLMTTEFQRLSKAVL